MHVDRAQRTGLSTRADEVLFKRAISQAKDLGGLFPLVVMLLQETEAMMDGRRLTESEIHRIAAPLAKIRLLLTALAPLACGRHEASIRDLVERYRDIEGRIKEMRNDLARARKRHIP